MVLLYFAPIKPSRYTEYFTETLLHVDNIYLCLSHDVAAGSENAMQ